MNNNKTYQYGNKEEFLKKFEKILKDRYENEDDIDYKFEKDYVCYTEPGTKEEKLSKKDGSITNFYAKIRRWRTYKGKWANTIPNLNDLIALCNVLDCDIEYFLTAQTVYKKDNLEATKKTGLSEKAIDNISKMDNSKRLILEILAENGSLDVILENIDSINVVRIKDITDMARDKKVNIDGDEATRFMFANRIIKEAKTIEKDGRYQEYLGKTYGENHPVEAEAIRDNIKMMNDEGFKKQIIRQWEKGIKQGKDFNQVCDEIQSNKNSPET